jgi:aminoglycoside phosphotransferase (APT) family kinase protein
MHEEHYTHGWLAAVLPVEARRYRAGDEALREVLESAGAELVEDEPEVEVVSWPDEPSGEAPFSVVTHDPVPLRYAGLVARATQRLTSSLATGSSARKAEARLREQGYDTSVLRWDIGQRVELPYTSVKGPSLTERLPRRAIVIGRRGDPGPTALEAALEAAGSDTRADWVSVRAGIVVAAAGAGILRVAVGGAARTQIHDQVAALEALRAAGAPEVVAERIPWVTGSGTVGLADWSLERRLTGVRPRRELGDALLEECFAFLVGLRRRSAPNGRGFAELAAGPSSVARPETKETLKALADELERTLAGLDRGFAHGDFFAGNLLADGGRLTGVLDWDAGGPGRVPGIDLLHLQLTRTPYGGDDDWGRAVVERLLPAARSGGDALLRRYCDELGIEPDPRVLEALVYAYWLEYAAYQLRAHLDRRSQPPWIEGNIELVARAAEEFTKNGPGDRAAPTRTA